MKQLVIIIFFTSFFLQLNAQGQDSLKVSPTYFGYFGETNTVQILYSDYSVPENENEKFNVSKDWPIILLTVLVFSFFIGISFSFSEELNLVVKSLFSKVFFREILSQQSTNVNNLLLLFNVLFFLSVTSVIFLYLSVNLSIRFIIDPVLAFLLIFVGVVVFYLVKQFFANIWAYVLDNKEFSSVYRLSVKISNVFLATFLLFFVFSSLFNPFCETICIKIAIVLVLIVFIIRLWRIFYEFFQQGFSLFYLILYLCTVEILPPLLVIKYFSIV